ncbi:helix-turn-helix transcriptional regulator [Paenibacillus sp. RUD330]|uniref:helix-turn-helix domain-containing protein n=1 Tax=Paenibacillus sp. RUD330 TaxID=2023772 RepID=UPI000B92984A|nr:helix-turn-helix transcriptional regulator [Paenibacillus sp. RUD330]ASS64708.1 helix-turn-helix transcriptional regulator [Paenibacillus sp. RUD330]
MSFSDVVRKAAAVKNIKPAEIARRAGYSAQHIHDLMSGERRWNEDSINKICEVLDIQIRFEYEQEDPNQKMKI